MTWAQTTKIGCGKLFSYPDESKSRFGQQFFVCNYGLAGNLINSEMYLVGTPCSACPPGTSCSQQYPGLCAGEPYEPLTVKPPKYDFDFELLPRPQVPKEQDPSAEEHDGPAEAQGPPVVEEGPPAEVQVPPPIFIGKPGTDKSLSDKCVYTCKFNGGCSVRYSSKKVFSGSVLGSCFSKSFGGECSGTPARCRACNILCDGQGGKELTVELDKGKGSFIFTIFLFTIDALSTVIYDTGQPLHPTPEVRPLQPSSRPSIGEKPSKTGTSCTYSCQNNGGCSVRINSNTFIEGSVLGSCFPPDFGGSCSGTPVGCRDCLGVCQQRGKPGEVTLPADGER